MCEVLNDCWGQEDFMKFVAEMYTQFNLSPLVHVCNQEVCHSLNDFGRLPEQRGTEITKVRIEVSNGSNTAIFFLNWWEINGVVTVHFHNVTNIGTNEHAVFEFDEFDLLPSGNAKKLVNVILQDVLRIVQNPVKEFEELSSGGRKRILSLVE